MHTDLRQNNAEPTSDRLHLLGGKLYFLDTIHAAALFGGGQEFIIIEPGD